MMHQARPYPFGYFRSWPVPVLEARKRTGISVSVLVMLSAMLSLVAAVLLLLGCAEEREVDVPLPPPLPPAPVAVEAPAVYPFIPPLLPKQEPPPAPIPMGREWKVPRWIVAGILAKETRSVLRDDDTVKYVDKRRGASGERGPTQLKRIAFDQVSKPGEAYWKVEVDTGFALEITERYLLWLKKQTGSWSAAIRAYNAGLGGRGCSTAYAYYSDVKELAQ